MVGIKQVIPDLLNREETLALGGVARPYSPEEEAKRQAEVLRTLSVDGIYITPSKSPVAHGDKTRQQVLESLVGMAQKWVYFYGGWNNGMTLQVNICASCSGNIPLNQVKVRDIKEGLKSPNRPPIFYDYRTDYDPAGVVISGWRDMLRQKGIQVTPAEYEEMTLADLLLKVGGAPTRWNLMVTLSNGSTEHLLPHTTSSPFAGCEYGNGFIACYLKPVFAEGVFGKAICNTTGSRAVDSIALANLLVRLRHDAKTAIEIYIEDARRRLEEMEKRARERGAEFKPPYTMEEAERYAPLFVETQEPVVEDITGILAKYPEGAIEGVQYAVNITSDRSLATAVYKIPRSRPYCWVKTAKGWELAV